MESENKSNNGIWYVIGTLVVVCVVVLVWGSMSSKSTDTATPGTVPATNSTPERATVSNESTVVPTEALDSSATEAEQEEFEAERLGAIQSERERLLAEQAQLEASLEAEAAEGTTSLEQAERQAEIDRELLELQNQEEYPPLPDPGL